MTLLAATDSALTTQSRLMAGLLAALFVVFILELIRRHKLQERYTVLWLSTALAMVVVVAFPDVLGVVNRAFGMRTPGLALFAAAFLMLLAVVMHLTVAVSRQGERITRLSQELAIERAQRRDHQGEPTADEPRADGPAGR